MKIALLAGSLVLAAPVVLAAQSSEPAAQADQAPAALVAPGADTATAAAAEDERKICRTEKVTGSLSRRSRICLTAAQWREIHDRTRRGVDEMANSASGAPRCISAMDAACGAPGPGGAPGL